MKKLLVFILTVVLAVACIVPTALAECTATASASQSTVYVNSNVTFTFTFKGSDVIGSADTTFTFDNAKLKYVSYSSSLGNANINVAGGTIKISDYSGSATDKTYTVKITFTATSVGSAKVALSSSDIGDDDGGALGTPTTSTTVTIKEKSLSSDANLTYLAPPKGCTLVPKFSSTVTEYTCTVPYSVDYFPLDWTTSDKDAVAKGIGTTNIKVGENTRKVQVTAPDGTVKVYTVKITRLAPAVTPTPEQNSGVTPSPTPTAPPTTNITINNVEHVLEQIITLPAPEGFTLETYDLGSTPTQIALNGNIILVQLTSNIDSSFFIYNEQTKTFTPYKSVTTIGATYTYLAASCEIDVPLAPTRFTLDGVTFDALSSEKLGNGYYIFKAMNNKTQAVYDCVYCEADGTVQKLSSLALTAQDDNDENSENELSFIEKYWQYIVMGVLAILLILFIILFATKKGSPKKEKKQNSSRDWGFEAQEEQGIVLEGEDDNEPQEIFFTDFN